MPCFVAALAFFFPRITIILLALLSDYIGRAFNNEWLWPVLGFFFMPYTLLAYAFAKNANGSVDGLYMVLVIVAVLFDLGVLGGGASTSRKRLKTGKA
jgi:Flp pilus assembly protein protease CpaA